MTEIVRRDFLSHIRKFFGLKKKLSSINLLPTVLLTQEIIKSYPLEFAPTQSIDLTGTGMKLLYTIPDKEIWIPEWLNIKNFDAAPTAVFNSVAIIAHDTDQNVPIIRIGTPTADAIYLRGIDYPTDWWWYAGDRIYMNCSTGQAGDLGYSRMQFRRVRVG